MGEVRVKVKLTNPFDEELVRRGQLQPNEVRKYDADALVDTGAVRCVVPGNVVDHLGVSRIGTRNAEYADGRIDEVDLTDGIRFNVMGRETLEEALVLGDEVLIGQTVLEKLDLWVDCMNQRLVPNPAHPDQPVTKVKRTR
jgi:clan AA aspartic protease